MRIWDAVCLQFWSSDGVLPHHFASLRRYSCIWLKFSRKLALPAIVVVYQPKRLQKGVSAKPVTRLRIVWHGHLFSNMIFRSLYGSKFYAFDVIWECKMEARSSQNCIHVRVMFRLNFWHLFNVFSLQTAIRRSMQK